MQKKIYRSASALSIEKQYEIRRKWHMENPFVFLFFENNPQPHLSCLILVAYLTTINTKIIKFQQNRYSHYLPGDKAHLCSLQNNESNFQATQQSVQTRSEASVNKFKGKWSHKTLTGITHQSQACLLNHFRGIILFKCAV